jgi:hypothetical protein
MAATMPFIGAQIPPELLEQLDSARELDRRGPRAVAIRYAIELYVQHVAAQVSAGSLAINEERPARDGPRTRSATSKETTRG